MNKDNLHKIAIVEISESPIELYKLLKFANLVQSGAQSKIVISENLVKVNGEVEIKKRKKITEDDIIEFNGQKIRIIKK